MPLLFDPQGGQQPVDIQQVAETTVAAGAVAVVAVLFTGLGWIGASIEGVRRMQGAMQRGGNVVIAKVRDLAFLLCLGVVLGVALIGSIGVQTLSDDALSRLGLGGDRAWLVDVGGLLIAALLLWVALVSLYASAWWRRPQRSWTAITVGALGASLVLVVLLQVSFLVVGGTLSNPVYGTLAVAAALLIFLYVASAVMLYFAAWVSVREGAPRTQEELAFASRAKGGDVMLPAVVDAVATTRDR
jgi:membrane protein